MKTRGVEDILISCIDNLKGFAEAIQATFPKTEVQRCIVHQIRNSLKYVASKDQKPFLTDLKEVYQADTKDLAEQQLDVLDQKWGKKYAVAIASWKNNWNKLSTYFKYDPVIRKLISTTNTIEGIIQRRQDYFTTGVRHNSQSLSILLGCQHTIRQHEPFKRR